MGGLSQLCLLEELAGFGEEWEGFPGPEDRVVQLVCDCQAGPAVRAGTVWMANMLS